MPRPTAEPASAVVFVGGEFVPVEEARISPLDRGLLYGDALFETIRIYPEGPFALGDHLKRLSSGARTLRLPIPRERTWWKTRIRTLLDRNALSGRDAAVRLTVTRGVGGEGLVFPRRPTPTILMIARSLPTNLAELRREGVPIVLLDFHPGSDRYLQGLKTTDYLTAAIGKTVAHEQHAFEGLYVRKGREVLEGTTSNIFVVRRGVLATPALSRGVLPGTTRDRVLVLAQRAGISVIEGRVSVSSLLNADEAFLTASTLEVMPIVRVDGVALKPGPRPITRMLQNSYTCDRKARARWRP